MLVAIREIEDATLLVENMMSRMDFNDTQNTWKLTGNISRAEHKALMDMRTLTREKIREMKLEQLKPS